MFHRLAITFGVVCASSFGFVSASLADSISVPFSGVVLDHASINLPDNLQSVNFNSANKSNNNSLIEIPLQFQVQSSRAISVSVSSSQSESVSFSNQFGANHTQSSNIGSNSTNSKFGKKNAMLSAGSNDLEMNLLFKKPEAVTSRTDTHEIVLTITPQ